MSSHKQCFVCDEDLSASDCRSVVLLSALSRYTRTGLPTKIGQLIGDEFIVVVTACDAVCLNCVDLINQVDKLEFELKKLQKVLTSYLHKKYGLLNVKEEPFDSYEDGEYDETGARHGAANPVDSHAAIAEENSRICEVFRAALKETSLAANKSTDISVVEETVNQLHKCSRCVLRFKNPKDLRNHEKVHSKILTKTREHACNRCDFKTTSKSVFDVHIRKHVVVKPFKCSHCNSRFASQAELDRHAVSHSVVEAATVLVDASCLLETPHEIEQAESENIQLKQEIEQPGVEEILEDSDVNKIGVYHGDSVVELRAEGSEGDNDEYEERAASEGSLDGDEAHATGQIFMDGVEMSLSQIVESTMPVDGALEENLDPNDKENELCEDEVLMHVAEDDSARKMYACSVCEYRSPIAAVLRQHLETHRTENLLECGMCGLKLKTQRTYDKHVKRHNESPVPAACTVCKQILSDRLTLRKHMNDEHPTSYKCKYCDLVCASVRARRRHEASHPATMTRTCDVCGKSFRRSTQLQVHKEYAHREPKCRICGKEFDKAVKLKEHERRHAREKEGFSCNSCSKTFKTRSGLKLHRAKHTGQYKFCCDVCGRGFMSKVILEEHMGRHTQENRYTCDVCGKMFVFNSTMRIHRKWHDNPLPYKCVTCGQKFRHTSLLSVHRRRMHTGERPYKCPYCALSFTVSSCLKRHVVLHTGAYPYFCDPCSKGFTTREKLAMHLAKIHNDREMLNTKARPCQYKVVLPNQPGQGPADREESVQAVSLLDSANHVVHIGDMVHVQQMEQVEEVGHIIIQDDGDGLDAEGAIQLQIIAMDTEHGIPGFE